LISLFHLSFVFYIIYFLEGAKSKYGMMTSDAKDMARCGVICGVHRYLLKGKQRLSWMTSQNGLSKLVAVD
jgi:hypothetical protein